MMKSTYGTGCFALLNTGATPVASKQQAAHHHRLSARGERTYALEGSIFVAGAAVQWLRDGLGIIAAAETGPSPTIRHAGVYLVPAFVGLGAPYWDPACAAPCSASPAHRPGRACARGAGVRLLPDPRPVGRDARRLAGCQGRQHVLRVDGGMVASDWTMQRLADLLGAPVDRPMIPETTALGAAYLAGLQAGLYPSRQNSPTTGGSNAASRRP